MTLDYLGALAFYGSSAKDIGHVAICLSGRLMVEAGGGGSDTTTAAVAAKRDAFVRIRPIRRRADLVAIVRWMHPGGYMHASVEEADLLLDYLMGFVGVQYRWGNADPIEGFDCSGFAHEILSAFGAWKGPRTTAQGLHDHFRAPGHGLVLDLPTA